MKFYLLFLLSMKFDNKTLANYFAEFLGTFIFVTIIFLSVIVARGVEAFSIGLGLIALIYAFGKYTKAHFNPIVTLGAFIAKKINLQDALLYMFVQLAAVFMAFGVGVIVRESFIDYQVAENSGFTEDTDAIRTQIEEAYVLYNEYPEDATAISYILEGFFAYVFVLVAIMVMDNQKLKNSGGFVLGLTLFVAIAVSSQITGGAFHPFRSLIPGLFNFSTITDGNETVDTLNYFGVYFFGPFAAASLAGATYWIFRVIEKPIKISATVEGSETKEEKSTKKETKKSKSSKSK